MVDFSVAECLRASVCEFDRSGIGRWWGTGPADVGSSLGVPGAVEGLERFIPSSEMDLGASFVENIRVSRFVIEGFSVAV